MNITREITVRPGLGSERSVIIVRKTVTEIYEALDDQGNWVEKGACELLTSNFKHSVEFNG